MRAATSKGQNRRWKLRMREYGEFSGIKQYYFQGSLITFSSMALFSVFGRNPTGARLERVLASPNYRDGVFQNLEPTTIGVEGAPVYKVLWDVMRKPANTRPGRAMPSVQTDLKALPDDRVSIVWFGHSSYLLKVYKRTILVDPVFSGHAAPFPGFAKAFAGTGVYDTDKLPDEIDILLLTHDHFDHLDYRTVLRLKDRVGHIVTSLGVGSHLESWGFDMGKVTELDWWEEWRGADLFMMATPARHFSGRSLKRNQTLWSGFVLKMGGHDFFLGGDSGYGEHFKEIGRRCGPFDLAILECGQYGKYWPKIHMFPEQVVQAARDLGAKKLMPVHWGKFSLALHPWNEPVKRVVMEAGRVGQHITVPMIGQPVVLGHFYQNSDWWDLE